MAVGANDGRQADADLCAAVACPVPEDDAELPDGFGAAHGTQIRQGKAAGNPGQDDTEDVQMAGALPTPGVESAANGAAPSWPRRPGTPLAPHLDPAPEPAAGKLLARTHGLRRVLAGGGGLSSVLDEVLELLRAVPGSVGLFARSLRRPLEPRPPHLAAREIFPLPWLDERRYADGVAGRLAGRPQRQAAQVLTDVWIALLNYMHWGPHFRICWSRPSAAQRRAQQLLLDRARGFVQRCPSGGAGWDAIISFLRDAQDGYSSTAGVLPLGLRAGVPAIAATVDRGSAALFRPVGRTVCGPRCLAAAAECLARVATEGL